MPAASDDDDSVGEYHPYSDGDLESALNEQIEGRGRQHEAAMLDALIRYAHAKSFQLGMEGKYDDAGKIDDAIRDFKRLLADAQGVPEVKATRERLEQARQREQKIRNDYQQAEEGIHKDFDQREAALRSDYEQRIKNIEEEFARPATQTKYARPSAELLTLRKAEKASVLSRDFAGAKQLKEQADALEAAEAVEAGRRLAAAIDLEVRQVRRKLEQELAVLRAKRHAWITEMRMEELRALDRNAGRRRALAATLAATQHGPRPGWTPGPKPQNRIPTSMQTRIEHYRRERLGGPLTVRANVGALVRQAEVRASPPEQ